MSSEGKLDRWQATALAISFVVGSGILVLPVLSLQAAGAVASLQAWLLMGLIGLPLVSIFYKMSSRGGFTLTGCFVDAFGESSALSAKITILGALLFAMPAMVYTTSSLVLHLFRIEVVSAGLLSHVVLSALCLNQLRPLKQSSRISVYSALLLFLLIAVSIAIHTGDLKAGVSSASHSLPRFTSSFFRASTLSFFGYVGWESLSFFSSELRDPKRDLKWIYGGSFGLVTVFYLALSAVIAGAALRGEKFGIQEGFLSLLPDGLGHLLSCSIMVILLLANLNAWIFGGTQQIRELAKKSSRGEAVLYYYLAVSLLILLLELGAVDLPNLFLLSNQCWIVIYGGILAFYFKNFSTPGQRLLGLFGCIGFFLLLMGCSKLMVLNVAVLVLFRGPGLLKGWPGSRTYDVMVYECQRR